MKYSGIDLHSNNSVVTVTDERDRVVAEKRLPNDLSKIVAFLLPWRDELAGVVVESTYNWYWLVDGLQEAGFEVKLANTGAIKKYDGLKTQWRRGGRPTIGAPAALGDPAHGYDSAAGTQSDT
jgi:transposase